MQKVGDFVLELHKKHYNHQGVSYEEAEFNQVLNEMNRLNLEKPKEERIILNRSEIKSIDDMNTTQMQQYEKFRQQRIQLIQNRWKDHIEAFLEYKKPNLVDAHQLADPCFKENCDNLYVHPCFMKAGKHNYLVYDPEESYYTMHTTICDFRSEDPPKCKSFSFLKIFTQC